MAAHVNGTQDATVRPPPLGLIRDSFARIKRSDWGSPHGTMKVHEFPTLPAHNTITTSTIVAMPSPEPPDGKMERTWQEDLPDLAIGTVDAKVINNVPDERLRNV